MFVLPVIAGIVTVISLSSLPAPLLEYLQATPSGTAALFARLPKPVPLLSGILVIAVGLASFVGLWRFRRWGRSLYVAFTIVYILIMPLMGVLVLPAAATPLLYVGYLLQGALIAMAYLPPIADVFATQKV
jgi:hypothetical protein